MKYPEKSQELTKLLAKDQEDWSAYAKAEFAEKLSSEKLQNVRLSLRKQATERGKRALQILDEINNKPTLENIGSEAAIALSVLATHYSLDATRQVLAAFEKSYKHSPENTHVASIPTMVDWIAVLEHRPQSFGTIWLVDSNKYPFLPIVADYENINKRRADYALEPLRWPKSLAIPEEEQPWLKRPLSEAVMRKPTDSELERLSVFYA